MTRVKVEPGGIPASVATNSISLGNLTVANPTATTIQGSSLVAGNATPGPSNLQSPLFGTSIDCYEDVFKEITKKLNCTWDEAVGGIAISDILDTSGVVQSVTTAQPIVYDTADLFRQDVSNPTATAATLTPTNAPGGLAIVAATPGSNGLPAGAIVVQRRVQDDKGRIWTIEGLPQSGEQIAFATVSAQNTNVALQPAAHVPIQPQSSNLAEPIQTYTQPIPEQTSIATTATAAPTEERWFESEETLSWTQSKIGRYNAFQKVFRCVDCDFVGFLSRVAEHWLGNHADYRAFQCPRCPYTSAWARCVRMHLTRQHGETFTDNSHWKENPILEEVTKFLTTLKTKVEQKVQEAANEKRYSCPYCPYQTDRRDLYNRHENIHRDDKPFHCYICDKQFNRADHVKKHFTRMHRDHDYDINKIKKSSGNLKIIQVLNSGNKQVSKAQDGSIRQQAGTSSQQLEGQFQNQQVKQEIINHGQTLSLPLNASGNADAISVQNVNQSLSHIACFNPTQTPDQSGPIQGMQGVGGSKKEGKTKGHKKKKSGEKMYTCSYCPWQGVDNWCLKRHLNTHIKPFLCALCDYKAARSERLATHVLKVHNKRVCHKCSYLADDSESLSQHIQDSHQNPLVKTGFNCNICQEYFELRADLEAHAILEHQKVIVQCDLCDYRTTDELSMEAHLRNKHNLTPGSGAVAAAAAAAAAAAIGQHLNAPYVQSQVQTQLQLEPSAEQILNQGNAQANFISAAAVSGPSGNFNSNLQIITGDLNIDSEGEADEPDSLCDKCGIDFLDEQSRKLHEKRHELVNPAEDEAVIGAQAVKVKRFLRTYVCSTCSYTSSTKKIMMQHQRAHTGFELVCKAENCMFSTPFDNTLKEHIQNDHGSEEHVRCPHCGLRMPSSNAFTSHWRYHHRSICSLCVNIYRVKYDVKENEIHDFICKIPSSSSTSTSLIQDVDSSMLFKLDSTDFSGLSLMDPPRFEDDDLARLVLPDELEAPLGKRPKMENTLSQISSTATLYQRESIKFLPRLVEVNVTPMHCKEKFKSSKRRKRRKRSRCNRMMISDGAVQSASNFFVSKKTSGVNSFLNKYLKMIARKEAERGVVGLSRVSLKRRYCQKGTFSWLFRNSRDGYKCFSSLCDNRSSWRYPRKSGLVLHNLWYHRMSRFRCDICGLRFTQLYKAYLHKLNQHPDLMQQPSAALLQQQHQQVGTTAVGQMHFQFPA